MKKHYKKLLETVAMPSVKLWAAILLTLAIGTSCTKGEESELKVTFPGATTYAIPGPGTSCSSTTSDDVAKDSFAYRNIVLTWENTTDSVYILGIKLEFKNPNLASGSYVCFIAGDELAAIFANGSSAWDGSLAPPTVTAPASHIRTNSCSIRCGGVTYTPGLPTTSAVGTVTVIGVQRTPEGDEKPVKGTAQVKLNFGGI